LGNCHYIIAADQEQVWVGGRSVSCLSMSGGRVLWTTELPAASTGYAVRSGSLIHAPTVEGLVTLQASDGATVGVKKVLASHGPLGNLLCLHNSLYTINPAQVRIFPDIARSHADAVARLSASPGDAAAGVRLAWLELLNNDAARALSVLDGLPDAAFSGEGSEADAACQVMVETLLTRAAEVIREGGGAEALRLMKRADRIARSPVDRLRCALAIADGLAAGDQFAEAYRRLWVLGLSPYASQIVPLSDESVGSARLDIARRLNQLDARVTAEQRAEVLSQVAADAERAASGLGDASTRRAAEEKLAAIADLAPLGGLRERAVRSLVAYHRERGSSEAAEQWTLRQADDSAPGGPGIGPLLQTAQIYGELAAFDDRALGTMVHNLEGLATRSGAEPLRDAITPGEGSVDSASTLKEWIDRFLSRFPSESVATARERFQESPVQLSGQLAWTREWGNTGPRPSVVQFSEPRPPLLTDRFVLYTPDDRLACYNADSVDEPVWQTSLRLPGTFESDATWMRERQEPETRRAVADGQTAVIAGDDGLFAVGLVTGRRLWVRSFEPPGHSNRAVHPDTAIAVGDGLLAALPRAGRLTLMQLSDGATIWERDLYGEPVYRVWMIGDRIIVSDETFTRVLLIDRHDGRLLQRILFEQPDPNSGLIDIVVSGHVLCGPLAAEDFEGVAAIDLQTGEALWRIPVEKPLAQLFQPRDGFVGISLLGGDVWVVDAFSGEVQINRRVAGAHVVIDGLLVDGTFIVQHVNPENEGRLHHLTGLDVATQEEVWRRTDIVPPPKGSRPLRVVHGMIPTFVAALQERGRASQDVRAALVDPRTGLSAGTMTPLPSVTTATRTAGDFEVFPGADVAVVMAPNAMFAIRTERIAGTPKGF
jgi:outer membrane protein assembly factor BamB